METFPSIISATSAAKIASHSVMVTAVDKRCGCPIRHPSPKNSSALRSAITASLQCMKQNGDFDFAPLDVENEITASPPCVYNISPGGCVEMPRPLAAVSRNFAGLNPRDRFIAAVDVVILNRFAAAIQGSCRRPVVKSERFQTVA